jgi:AhpD family alkylhydroperoxidase
MTITAPSSSDHVAAEPRFDLADGPAAEQYKAMRALSAGVRLDRPLRELINVRVSQLNGCAFCMDMHLVRARALGETQQRLDVLAGWRDAPFFTARERAALALAEAITKVGSDGSVPDAVYDEAARHFDAGELPQVVFAATVINAWNRLLITAGTHPPAR